MANRQEQYDEAVQLRTNALLLLMLIGFLAFSIISFNLWRDHRSLEVKAEEKQEKLEKNTAYNEKMQLKIDKQDEEIGQVELRQHASDFNSLFFGWSTWDRYSSNMSSLRNRYPNIEKEGVVNISGKDTGQYEAPRSSSESVVAMTTDPDKIVEFINQHKIYKKSEGTVLWYKVSEYKDGKYSITQMEPIRMNRE